MDLDWFKIQTNEKNDFFRTAEIYGFLWLKLPRNYGDGERVKSENDKTTFL